MSSPKISIVIPVYNTEKFIDTCLESCITQTLKDIEIIIVDDCGSDGAIAIAGNYAKKDSRIKIIHHEKNKGLGGARNTGINVAIGEYLWFLDSDDYIAENSCQILYDYAKEKDLEIIQFSSCNFKEINNTKIFSLNLLNNPWTKSKLLNPSDKKSGLSGCPNVTAWSYIAKTSLIKNFEFREGVYHEDVDFTLKLFSKCKRFETISYTAYYYRINPDSITNTTLSERRLNDIISLCYVLKDYVKQNKYKKGYFVYDSFIDFVRNSKRTIETFDSRDLPEIKEFLQEFRKI